MDIDLNEIKKNIGQRLRSVRKNMDLTQLQFSEMMGIGRESYTKIEKGDNMPTGTQLYKIRKFLNISVDWVLTGQSDLPDFDYLNKKIVEMLNVMHRDEGLTHAILADYFEHLGRRQKTSVPVRLVDSV